MTDVWYTVEVVGIVVLTVVVFYTFYRVVAKYVPGWGTIITNAVASATILIEALQGVPWHYVLSTQQVSYVTFGLFITNMLMRITKTPQEAPTIGRVEISIDPKKGVSS
jgi:hypothetical protein